MTPAERYLLLGLRLGRHVDGLVDAYYGPLELKEQADAEPLVDAATLAADAESLLADVGDGWLGDQVLGLRTYAGVVAGETISYSDEVERCYGVRPDPPTPDAYAEAHGRLDELLPGDGSLADRREAFRQSQVVPAERMLPALRDVVAELRSRTEALVSLPEGEALELEQVSDEPWWAFNYYLGDLRSRVVLNTDIPTTADDLIVLAAHEVYPGHHTEHALKEQLLIRDRGLVEEGIQLVPTPQAVLSEGIAEIARELVEPADAEALVAILRRHGLHVDERVAALREASRALRRIGLDLALMIHEERASSDEAEAYAQRWSLSTPKQAKQSVRFVTDPTWRAYVITYSAGGDLARAYVRDDPARFRRLLTEHVRVGDLFAAA